MWASGWVEDVTIDGGDGLADIYQHVADTWGGQRYQVDVLSGSQVLYTGRLTVAGPPRDSGRVIDRSRWEGRPEENPRPQPQPPPPPAAPDMFGQVERLMTLFVGMQRDASDRQVEAMRDMSTRTVEATRELVSTIVARRERQEERPAFTQQLGEIMEAATALEGLKKRFGAASPSRDRSDDEGDLSPTLRAARDAFIHNVVGNAFGPRRAPAAGPAAAGPQHRSPNLPEAAATRQPNGKTRQSR